MNNVREQRGEEIETLKEQLEVKHDNLPQAYLRKTCWNICFQLAVLCARVTGSLLRQLETAKQPLRR